MNKNSISCPEHEAGVINTFVLSRFRERLLSFAGDPRKRRKFTSQLPHQRILDPRMMMSIPKGEQTAEGILDILISRGAPQECCIISESLDLDQCRMPLAEALEAVVGYGVGTIISCIPGALGYYEGEEKNQRYLLLRPR